MTIAYQVVGEGPLDLVFVPGWVSQLEAMWLARRDLPIRAGIHTGECEPVGDKVRGIAVHIGARIASLAAPGEVLVSSTVKDLMAGSGL